MSSSRTSENAPTRLAVLREKKPPSKAAQIRGLWPEIRTALNNGHSPQAAVCDRLAADGIGVSVQRLGSYIGRIRRSSVKGELATLSPALADPGSTKEAERAAVLPVREEKPTIRSLT